MSLVNTLLNGGMDVSVSIDATKYSHSNGANRIAMESVAELHDIFMESFYNTNQAELAAATEGVALEGSQYQAVSEAAVSNAFAKIKEFLKKLWEKVKAFFHNIRRYFDSLVMSGTDFVKKYKADIKKIGTLKDFEFKMYDYANDKINGVSKASTDEIMDTIIATSDENVKKMLNDTAHQDEMEKGLNDDDMEEMRKLFDHDNIVKQFAEELGLASNDPAEFDVNVFKYFRNGAENSGDKKDVSISNVNPFLEHLEKTSKLVDELNTYAKRVDAAYAKAIKAIEKFEKAQTAGDRNNTKVAELARMMSSALSNAQTCDNKFINAWKVVVKERDAAYKQMLIAAFDHQRKNAKK